MINKDEWLRVEKTNGIGMVNIRNIVDVLLLNESGIDTITILTMGREDNNGALRIIIRNTDPSFQTIYDMFFGEGGGGDVPAVGDIFVFDQEVLRRDTHATMVVTNVGEAGVSFKTIDKGEHEELLISIEMLRRYYETRLAWCTIPAAAYYKQKG